MSDRHGRDVGPQNGMKENSPGIRGQFDTQFQLESALLVLDGLAKSLVST